MHDQQAQITSGKRAQLPAVINNNPLHKNTPPPEKRGPPKTNPPEENPERKKEDLPPAQKSVHSAANQKPPPVAPDQHINIQAYKTSIHRLEGLCSDWENRGKSNESIKNLRIHTLAKRRVKRSHAALKNYLEALDILDHEQKKIEFLREYRKLRSTYFAMLNAQQT